MLNQDEWELSGQVEIRPPKDREVFWNQKTQQFEMHDDPWRFADKYPIARRKQVAEKAAKPEPQWTVGQPSSGEWEVLMKTFGQRHVHVSGGNCQWFDDTDAVCVCNVDKVVAYRAISVVVPPPPDYDPDSVKFTKADIQSFVDTAKAAVKSTDKPVAPPTSESVKTTHEWTVEVSEPKKPREKDPLAIIKEAQEQVGLWSNAVDVMQARHKIVELVGTDIDKANKVLAMLEGNAESPWTEGVPGDGVWWCRRKHFNNPKIGVYEAIEMRGKSWRCHTDDGSNDAWWDVCDHYITHYQPFTPPVVEKEKELEPPKWLPVKHQVTKDCVCDGHAFEMIDHPGLYVVVNRYATCDHVPKSELTFLDKEPV